VNLISAIQTELGISVNPDLERYHLDGWYLEGTAPIQCHKCASSIHVFRCPYTTNRGEFRYWAIVCVRCESVTTFDQLPADDQKALRKWSRLSESSEKLAKRDVLSSGSAKPNKTRPTSEQIEIVKYSVAGEDLSINALAGTGKTTTLRFVAEALAPRRGHYVAFNRAIVDEAKSKFPDNINCVTAHSLAFRSVGSKYKSRLTSPRVSNSDLAIYFDSESFVFRTHKDSYEYESSQMARFASQCVWNFCKSIDDEISKQHAFVPSLVSENPEAARGFQELVVNIAQKMWSDLNKKTGTMKFEHDHYLKMWQLTRPSIPGDVILFDEAQDADPVMLVVINSQQHAQLIYCGDTYQSIYEWRGARDALQLVNVDRKLWLTQSFRFGHEIASVGNQYLQQLGSPVTVRGLPSIHSEVCLVEEPDAVLCRTNVGIFFSLREAQLNGRRVALPSGFKEGLQSFTRGCLKLIQGERSGHPELAPFTSWRAALDWANEESDELSEAAMQIRLVDSFGAGQILRMLDEVVEEPLADVVISTAHRAKGREWNRVRLAGDFHHPDDMSDDELKLTYVAVTRARNELDISQFPERAGSKPRLFDTANDEVSASSRKAKKRPPISFS
jgi:hypothetical protein